MAITETLTRGTSADVQDTDRDTGATWTMWAEANTAGTFYYWTGTQSVSDDGPTLDVYPGRELAQEQQPELTAEEAREEERFKQLRIKEKKEVKEADHKAGVLLLELIGRVDYKKFCRAGYIDVEGNSGKIYRIKPGEMTKVFAGQDKLDVALESLCIAMKDRALPKGDEMVWKKLMIESNEKAFVETANHFN